MKTIVGLFPSPADAATAIYALRESGFPPEAALQPETRGKDYADVVEYLHAGHPDVYRTDAFRRGYERGRVRPEAPRGSVTPRRAALRGMGREATPP